MEVALVLLGFGLSLVTQFATREWGKNDKANEQYEARLDRYRDDLRLAFSQFYAAASHFILMGFSSMSTSMGVHLMKDQNLEVPDELRQADRTSFDQMIAASHDAEAKAVGVLLLLENSELRGDVHFIGLKEWVSDCLNNDQRLEFIADMQARRNRLNELSKKLTGMFVPERPKSDGLIDPAPSRS